ncbi:hypothetical protein Celaphus_00000562 [Cervus elaphus hippelaphus]|uniref:FH2 domain-containing protein n=1 Tax=Cervus elaphus hippelaphus TaxID=46360 RepID=A0A212D9V8_CEREH|nr:hypothetical protein Celaphus_00000562 [Cervus elaphus hippelaphus]
MADRELLNFLESSMGSPEKLKPSNSSRGCLWQVPPDRACREPGEPRGQDSSLAHRPRVLEGQEEAPHPTTAWPSWLPAAHPEDPACALRRPRRSGVNTLRKRSSAPVGMDPVRSSPPLSPLALGIREHELVTGLAQFDLQAPKGPEEPAGLTGNDCSPMELVSVRGESPQSLGATNSSPTPVGRGAQVGPGQGPVPQDGGAAPSEPRGTAALSEGSSDPERQDPGPLFCISDTSDCSLTLDCSEGANSRPLEGDPGEAGDGEGSMSPGAWEMGGSQASSNPICSLTAEAPAAASTPRSGSFALEKLTELERWKRELQVEAHTLIDFFCEDKDTVKLDECLQIFRDFCVRFNKAVKVQLRAAPRFLSCLDFCLSSAQPGPACGGKGPRWLHSIRKVWPRGRCLAVPRIPGRLCPLSPEPSPVGKPNVCCSFQCSL